jgi:hypothetical protein
VKDVDVADWTSYWWPLLLIGGLGILLFLLCLVGFVCLVRKTLQGRFRHLRIATLIGLVSLLALLFAGLTLIFLSVALISNFYAYRALTRVEPVAEICCLERTGDTDFVITFTPIRFNERLLPEVYSLTGDQWMVGADIVKWQPFMNYLGFHTQYKISRLEGRYLLAEDQSNKKITAFELNGGTDSVWLELYRKGSSWPFEYFVDEVYGSAVYQLAEPGSLFQVLVTTSGLMTRRIDSVSSIDSQNLQ